MNKLLHKLGKHYVVLQTPCFPCSFYVGPAHEHPKHGWLTEDNATHRFYKTEKEALTNANKEFGNVL